MTLRTVQTLLCTPLLASNKFAHLTCTIKVSCLSLLRLFREYENGICVRACECVCVLIMETLVTQRLPLNLHTAV